VRPTLHGPPSRARPVPLSPPTLPLLPTCVGGAQLALPIGLPLSAVNPRWSSCSLSPPLCRPSPPSLLRPCRKAPPLERSSHCGASHGVNGLRLDSSHLMQSIRHSPLPRLQVSLHPTWPSRNGRLRLPVINSRVSKGVPSAVARDYASASPRNHQGRSSSSLCRRPSACACKRQSHSPRRRLYDKDAPRRNRRATREVLIVGPFPVGLRRPSHSGCWDGFARAKGSSARRATAARRSEDVGWDLVRVTPA